MGASRGALTLGRRMGLFFGLVALTFTLLQHAALATTNTTPKFTFQANFRLQNPQDATGLFLNQDVEPSIKIDTDNDVYIGAIRGVPGGVDLWHAGPSQVANHPLYPAFLGQPDNFSSLAPFAAGGGDIDIATGLPYPNMPTNLGPIAGAPTGNLYTVSLFLANIQLDLSKAQGANGSWLADPFATQTSADDRQWAAGDGPFTLYMTRSAIPGTPAGSLQTSISNAPGAVNMFDAPGSFADTTQMQGGAPISTLAFIAGQHHGNVVIDHTPNPATGQPTLYMPFATVDNLADAQADAVNIVVPFHTLYMAIGTPVVVGGKVVNVNWKDVIVWDGPKTDGVDHIFPSVAVDQKGNVYVMFVFGGHIMFMTSRDHGMTWNASNGGQPVQVDSPLLSQTNLFPWLDAGALGKADLVWYGTQTTASPDDKTDQWNVYFAQSGNAIAANPTFNEQIISDHIIHSGGICQLGLSCNTTSGENRNLADLFQVAIDGFGQANVAYTDDHIKMDSKGNTIPPTTYYTRQLAGPRAEPANNTQATQLMGGGAINVFPNPQFATLSKRATQLSGGGLLRLMANPRVPIGTYDVEVGFPSNSSIPRGSFAILFPRLGINLRSTAITQLAFMGQEAIFKGESNLGPFSVMVFAAFPNDRQPTILVLRLLSLNKSMTLTMPQGAIEAYDAW